MFFERRLELMAVSFGCGGDRRIGACGIGVGRVGDGRVDSVSTLAALARPRRPWTIAATEQDPSRCSCIRSSTRWRWPLGTRPDPLVRADLPGGVRAVLALAVRRVRLPQFAVARLDAARRRGHAVPRRLGVVLGGRLGYIALLQARLLPRPTRPRC